MGADDHLGGGWAHFDDVAGFAECNAEALALADGETGRSPVAAEHGAIGGDHRPRPCDFGEGGVEKEAVVALHETEVLAIGLGGGTQAQRRRPLPHLRLGHLPDREPDTR